MNKAIVGIAVAATLALAAVPVLAAPPEKVRLGFVSSLSGPVAIIGKEQQLGFELALKQLGNKLGGIPVEVFIEDGKQPVDTGKQAVTKLVESDKVDFLVGNLQSHQILAYLDTAASRDIIVLSSLPGPSKLAGDGCNRNLFVYSWENNSPSEVVGQYMTASGAKRAFVLSQNYVSGKEHAEGAKTFFKGTIVGEAYVPVPQVDYAAEISSIRASGADSAYVFLPGAGGIAFVKQFANSGLANRVKLYSGSWMADELTFGGIGDAALSLNLVANWFADLDAPANKTFTEAFQKEHGRKPALYAAFVYDSIFALDKAISTVKGEVGDKEGLRKALRAADFASTRGKLKFGNNQFPIQDFYAAQVTKKDGLLQHQVVARIAENYQDRFHEQCPMK